MWQNSTNQFGPKRGCCPLQAKFRLLYDNSFAPALGGAFALGTNTMALIQRCQIQAIMTVPQRLPFSAQLSNCNLATSGFATRTIPQGAPMGRGLLSMGKQSIRKSCRCQATRCYKEPRTFGLGPPPPAPPE